MAAKVVKMEKKPKKYSDDQLAGLLTEALEVLPDNYLMCRDMRHAWDLEEDFYVDPNAKVKHGSIRRRLRCLRCGMARVERFIQTKWGLEKIGQNYIDPEGTPYRIHGVPRGVKPSIIVQGVQYRRSMEKVASAKKASKAG